MVRLETWIMAQIKKTCPFLIHLDIYVGQAYFLSSHCLIFHLFLITSYWFSSFVPLPLLILYTLPSRLLTPTISSVSCFHPINSNLFLPLPHQSTPHLFHTLKPKFISVPKALWSPHLLLKKIDCQVDTLKLHKFLQTVPWNKHRHLFIITLRSTVSWHSLEEVRVTL